MLLALVLFIGGCAPVFADTVLGKNPAVDKVLPAFYQSNGNAETTVGGVNRSSVPVTNVPPATATQPGIVKPDNVTTVVSNGVLTVIGGGGGGGGSSAWVVSGNLIFPSGVNTTNSALAKDIVPDPSNPGNLGSVSNAFPHVYATNLDVQNINVGGSPGVPISSVRGATGSSTAVIGSSNVVETSTSGAKVSLNTGNSSYTNEDGAGGKVIISAGQVTASGGFIGMLNGLASAANALVTGSSVTNGIFYGGVSPTVVYSAFLNAFYDLSGQFSASMDARELWAGVYPSNSVSLRWGNRTLNGDWTVNGSLYYANGSTLAKTNGNLYGNNINVSFTNIAQMITSAQTNSVFAHVFSYYGTNDWAALALGGGDFYWTATLLAATNWGTVFAAAGGGYWNRINPTYNVLDMTWFGVTAGGDVTVQLQNSVDSTPYGGKLLWPAGPESLGFTLLTISNKYKIEISGPSDTSGGSFASGYYIGTTQSPVLVAWYNTGESTMKNISLYSNPPHGPLTTNIAAVMIDVDETPSFTTTCTHDRFESILFNNQNGTNCPQWRGIRFGHTSNSNVEKMMVYHCEFYPGYDSNFTNNGIGIEIGNDVNAFNEDFRDLQFGNGAADILTLSGSFSLDGGFGEAPAIDFNLQSWSGPIEIRNFRTEGPNQFMEMGGGYGGVTVEHCSVPIWVSNSVPVIDVTNTVGRGAVFLTLINNMFDIPAGRPLTHVNPNGVACYLFAPVNDYTTSHATYTGFEQWSGRGYPYDQGGAQFSLYTPQVNSSIGSGYNISLPIYTYDYVAKTNFPFITPIINAGGTPTWQGLWMGPSWSSGFGSGIYLYTNGWDAVPDSLAVTNKLTVGNLAVGVPAGAVAGYVFTLTNAATGQGTWQAASSLTVSATNGTANGLTLNGETTNHGTIHGINYMTLDNLPGAFSVTNSATVTILYLSTNVVGGVTDIVFELDAPGGGMASSTFATNIYFPSNAATSDKVVFQSPATNPFSVLATMGSIGSGPNNGGQSPADYHPHNQFTVWNYNVASANTNEPAMLESFESAWQNYNNSVQSEFYYGYTFPSPRGSTVAPLSSRPLSLTFQWDVATGTNTFTTAALAADEMVFRDPTGDGGDSFSISFTKHKLQAASVQYGIANFYPDYQGNGGIFMHGGLSSLWANSAGTHSAWLAFSDSVFGGNYLTLGGSGGVPFNIYNFSKVNRVLQGSSEIGYAIQELGAGYTGNLLDFRDSNNALLHGVNSAGDVLSTNGIGASLTVPIPTNAGLTHGYKLCFTNGVFVGAPAY